MSGNNFFGEKANKVANTILMALPNIPGDLALIVQCMFNVSNLWKINGNIDRQQ